MVLLDNQGVLSAYRLSIHDLRPGPGTLYTAIKRLVNAGLIEKCEPDADRRRCHRVTRKGRGRLLTSAS